MVEWKSDIFPVPESTFTVTSIISIPVIPCIVLIVFANATWVASSQLFEEVPTISIIYATCGIIVDCPLLCHLINYGFYASPVPIYKNWRFNIDPFLLSTINIITE